MFSVCKFLRYFWGLAIDTVAVINLVLAVGLSVDYAAHVAHSFMIKTGTRDERMVKVCMRICFLCLWCVVVFLPLVVSPGPALVRRVPRTPLIHVALGLAVVIPLHDS